MESTNTVSGQAGSSLQPAAASVLSKSSQPEKTLKRKFEDAIHVLDSAVRPSTPVEPAPSKRLRPSRSLYATLAKYGIKKDTKTPTADSRLESLSKSAPHLVAILSRTASRARNANPFKSGTNRPPPAPNLNAAGSEYRPSSTPAFLARLATYKLTTYANKPPPIDAVAASKCGWMNEGKDRLVCGICSVSWVLASKDGLNRDAANALVEKQRVQLVEMHKDGCPWKSRQCDASIYRVPVSTPAAMAKEVKSRAISLDSVLQDVQIKHPLTAAQAQTLQNIITSIKLHGNIVFPDDAEELSANAETSALLVSEPHETAIITALFGWSILEPSASAERPRSSLSRATSLAPSTPGTSRAMASPRVASRDTTPMRSTPRPSPFSRNDTSPSVTSIAVSGKPEAKILSCTLCQRRIGLWAFSTPSKTNDQQEQTSLHLTRQLDVLREHRSYCPYVVRSTVVPSLPLPVSAQNPSTTSLVSLSTSSLAHVNGSGELEGWRAVLSIILRYGATQRQRLGYSRSLHRTGRPSTDSMESVSESAEIQYDGEVDRVAAMVEGVKTRGGKDLLRYVKGLLG